MNPNPSAGRSLRRAALVLHAMAAVDQAWVLAHVSAQRRGRLETLLQELASLGIPADASLLRVAAQVQAEVTPPSAAQSLNLLSADQVAWLAGQLEREPAELSARLLAHHAWPWRAALLERLDAQRRQCVAAAEAGPTMPLPEAALCEALVRMLPERISPLRPSAAMRLWSRLRPALMRRVAAA